jgi:hypothetical protein
MNEPGFMAYACAVGVLASNSWGAGLQGAPGMFYINGDIIFTPCTLSGLNSGNIWYTSTLSLNSTAPAGSRSGSDWWRWSARASSVLSYNLSDALQLVFNRSYGHMAQRTAAYLNDGANSFQSHQADMFYLPAQFQKAYVDMAHQMHAQHVISEAALPNILGLLRSQPADVEPLSLAYPLERERTYLSKRYAAVMPLGSNLDAAVARKCVKGRVTRGRVYSEQESDKHGLFAMHALKLSDAAIAQHWIDWWMSQSC